MTRFFAASTLALVMAMFSLESARANVLTFDDLAGDESTVPDGYGGLDWNSQSAVGSFDAAHYGYQNTGYGAGTVSGSNVIFNYGGASPVGITSVNGGKFNYVGAYFTAAWQNETVSFTGLLNGAAVEQSGTYNITTTSALFIELDWRGINELVISNTGYQWAMDNFTLSENLAIDSSNISFVPEPNSMAMLSVGLFGFSLAPRRQARKI